MPSPMPPYSDGTGRPSTPKWAHFFQPSALKISLWSRWITSSFSSDRANAMAASCSCCCCSESSKSMPGFLKRRLFSSGFVLAGALIPAYQPPPNLRLRRELDHQIVENHLMSPRVRMNVFSGNNLEIAQVHGCERVPKVDNRDAGLVHGATEAIE